MTEAVLSFIALLAAFVGLFEYRRRRVARLLPKLAVIRAAILHEREELQILHKYLTEYTDRKGDNALLRRVYNARVDNLNKHIERYFQEVVRLKNL